MEQAKCTAGQPLDVLVGELSEHGILVASANDLFELLKEVS